MHHAVKRTGQSATISIIVLTVLFIILIILYPPKNYESTEKFISEFKIHDVMPAITGLLIVLANIPLFAAMYFYAPSERKIPALTGVLFGTGYLVCSGTSYFSQIGMISRFLNNTDKGIISDFIMLNHRSFVYAIDNLGYTFLSLSFIAFSGIFNQHGLQSWIKAVFVIYGIAGLTGAVGYITNYLLLENLLLLSVIPYLTGIVLLLAEFSKAREFN